MQGLRDFAALAPVAILVAGGLVLLVSEAFLAGSRRGYQVALAVATAALAAAAAVAGPARPLFDGQAVADGFAAFVTVIVCAGLALSAVLGAGWLHAHGAERGEYYALALFGTSGMVLLAMATDLLVAFVAIEVMSLSTYSLPAYMRRGRRPAEAAFKYFLLGAFSSALLLYGAALVYGAVPGPAGLRGSTLFGSIARAQASPLLLAGLGLVAVGLAFKVAAVPFHAWTPDVYEGAPTPVTAFMAAGVKAAAFAVLTRVFLAATAGEGAGGFSFATLLSALAVLTMVFGNLLALPQRSVKRMLAYSSVAHAGYLLVGVVATAPPEARPLALSSILFYLAAYAATVVGAFAVVGALERRGAHPGDEPADAWDLARFGGLARRRPALAFAMAVFLASLAGVPPTAGFMAKLLVFQAAVGAERYGLAVVGVLTSTLGAYYYLRVVVYMYMRPPEGAEEGIVSPAVSLAVAAAAVAVVALGVGPEPVAALARGVQALGF